MIIYLIYILIVLGILYYLFTSNYNYWQNKGVPFDEPFLIFGSFYSIFTRKEHIFHYFQRLYSKFKNVPYLGIYIFNKPTLVVNSPELVKKILVKDFDKFAERGVASNEKVDPISFHMLSIAKGPVWKALRSKISPVFTSGKMKLMLPLMNQCGENLNDYLNEVNGQVLEVGYLLKKYAIDTISSCAFGIDSNCLKNDKSEIQVMATKLLDTTSFVRGFSTFCYIFVPALVNILRMTFADKEACDYFLNVFRVSFEERKERKIVRNDLIELLDSLKNSENITDEYKFDDLKMGAQAILFFSAGNDTTALSLSYTLYELALNPEIQDRLRAELNTTIKKNEKLDYDTIQELKYLNMVVAETQRKYPLGAILTRKALVDYKIEGTGYTIEKDTPVMINVAGLHFDPQYFPDPQKFIPERFSDENKANIVPYTYLPFGEGPRNCIGQRFALLVTKVALVHILKDFAVQVCDKTDIPLRFHPGSIFLQAKNGLHLKIVKV